jgi:hypothetical protein
LLFGERGQVLGGDSGRGCAVHFRRLGVLITYVYDVHVDCPIMSSKFQVLLRLLGLSQQPAAGVLRGMKHSRRPRALTLVVVRGWRPANNIEADQ